MNFEWISDPTALVALATLVVMEIVLGIDNLIFISILTNKLPEHQRERARRIGIGAALILRLGLLSTVAFIVQLTEPLFTAFGHGFSWRDLILIAGGLFLVWKATKEVHHSVDPDPGPDMFDNEQSSMGFAAAIGQILLLDMAFSVDSSTAAGRRPQARTGSTTSSRAWASPPRSVRSCCSTWSSQSTASSPRSA